MEQKPKPEGVITDPIGKRLIEFTDKPKPKGTGAITDPIGKRLIEFTNKTKPARVPFPDNSTPVQVIQNESSIADRD